MAIQELSYVEAHLENFEPEFKEFISSEGKHREQVATEMPLFSQEFIIGEDSLLYIKESHPFWRLDFQLMRITCLFALLVGSLIFSFIFSEPFIRAGVAPDFFVWVLVVGMPLMEIGLFFTVILLVLAGLQFIWMNIFLEEGEAKRSYLFVGFTDKGWMTNNPSLFKELMKVFKLKDTDRLSMEDRYAFESVDLAKYEM